MTKQYDRAYFDRFYRNAATRVHAPGELRRKVSMAVSVAEYFLRRPIRNALDVGCGEGAWRRELRALRPGIEYTGIDSSDYAVARFGRTRNIRKGSFGDLPSFGFDGFDLVVCSDVLHYVNDREINLGIPSLAAACEGIAYIEVLTREDLVEGDLENFIARPAAWYRALFRRMHMTHVAPYIWLSPALEFAPSELDHA